MLSYFYICLIIKKLNRSLREAREPSLLLKNRINYWSYCKLEFYQCVYFLI